MLFTASKESINRRHSFSSLKGSLSLHPNSSNQNLCINIFAQVMIGPRRPKGSNIAPAKKVDRFNETFPQAQLRRPEQAESEAAHRASETPEQSQARRRRHPEYLASQRAAETPEQSQARRLQHATYMVSERDTETIEATESRKRSVAERAQQRRLILTKNTWGVFENVGGDSIKMLLSMTKLLIMKATSL
ncbi:hypothetical protein TNCV_4754341 [Trichonephila clavipes]|nr:hypothetical protein TNCV_4754341 [Trichonephila clavipes]